MTSPTLTTLATVTLGGHRPATRLHIRQHPSGDLSLSVHQSADGSASTALLQTYLTAAEMRTLAGALLAAVLATDPDVTVDDVPLPRIPTLPARGLRMDAAGDIRTADTPSPDSLT